MARLFTKIDFFASKKNKKKIKVEWANGTKGVARAQDMARKMSEEQSKRLKRGHAGEK